MKMPATTTKVEAKAATPSETVDAGQQCLTCVEKKVRNLEKRKGKIELSREKALKGTKLEKEQEVSLKSYEFVTHELEFAKELHKQFLTINEENEKLIKKQAKREKAERQANEIKRIGEILQLQSTLDQLGGDQVREDFKTGKHGAVVLTDDNLDQLDKLYQAISPSREDCEDYPQKLNLAAVHLVNILDGKDRKVMGTTYKELKELLTLINECGYFEKAPKADAEEVEEKPEASEESPVETIEEKEEESPLVDEETKIPVSEQKPSEIPATNLEGNTQSQMESPVQPMNTLEQDAFFAPSSTPYQSTAETHFSQPSHTSVPRSVPDFQSFTHNRPFQFIQTSYVMPDSASPSVVDPAVIAAQPAGGSGLQFMSQGFEPNPVSSSTAPPQQTQQQQHPSAAPVMVTQAPNVNTLGMPVDLAQSSVQQQSTQQQQPAMQQQPQDYTAQNFAQSENLFPTQSVGHEEVPLAGRSEMMGQRREESLSSASYEIPPSIPMPPSQAQQDQNSLDQHGKKFPMNVNATVFQSMYSQQQAENAQGGQVNMPPTAVTGASELQASLPTSDFTNSNTGPNGDFNSSGDFQQGYQGSNGFSANGNYSRGGGPNRGGYRGPRGGPGGNNRTGNPIQNGFGGRGGAGSNSNNSRGGRGGYNQGYPGNANYRPDGFQGGYNSGSFVNNTGVFPKRGGMNNSGTPGTGYPRGGAGGSGGRGGTRGVPRGAGGQRGNSRGGFNRALAQ